MKFTNFKILLCFGTRPEAIKMAPLFHELKATHFEVQVCVTAQHREMLDQVLDFFEIVPQFDLNLMQPNQTLNSLSASILTKIDEVLQEVKPDLVLVHGDTTTSSMVALASFHRNIKVGHVEAGLRTYDKKAPFPEEINRQFTGRIADFHFAPTIVSQQNLLNEHVPNDSILVTGNTIVDALLFTKGKLDLGYKNTLIENFQYLKNIKYILVTGHRRESFGQGFNTICEALLEIAKDESVQIIFPVHLNPNVKVPVNKMLGNFKNIHLIEPVDYPTMIWLLQNCTLVISDSGGIQEEAPSFNKPILVTRDVSERPEGIEKGFSFLVGTNKKLIVEKANYFLNTIFQSTFENPYGDGNASKKIVDFILKKY
jgi:UDP-N-acetylglucosamine 2-epimerase (non-hydrolysing)